MTEAVGYHLRASLVMPPEPRTADDLLAWTRQFHNAIQEVYMQISDRIENTVMVAETYAERPDQVGDEPQKAQRQFFYCLESDEIFLDLVDLGPGAGSYVKQWRALDTMRGRVTTTAGGTKSIVFPRNFDGFGNEPPIVHITPVEPGGFGNVFITAWITSWTRKPPGGAGTDYTGFSIEVRDDTGAAIACDVNWRAAEYPQ